MGQADARVLVVDDERFFREAIRDALVADGIACEAAASGQEALRLAGEPGVGAAVLDLGLPGLGGLEVLRELRKKQPLLRVVVVSAQPDQQDVLAALRLGASDYLAKPLHDEELVLAVRRALDDHALQSGYERLQGRMRALESRLAELSVCARDAPAERRDDLLAALAVEAAAEVLDASKTSLMRLEADAGTLRVVAASGRSLPVQEMDVVLVGEGVAGRAIQSGEAFAVRDVASDSRFSARSHYDTPSFAVAPIHGPGRPLGVLCASDRNDGSAFGDAEVALLNILSHQLGPLLAAPGPAAAAPDPEISFENTQPLEDGPTGDRYADLAREVCEAITVEVEPERLLRAALRPVARELPAAPVALHLLDAESGQLLLEAQVEDGRPDHAALPAGRGLTGSVLQTGHLVATEKPDSDPRFDAEVDAPEDGQPGPLLCVPLRVRGKVLGVLRAFPRDGAPASARAGEILAASCSAAVRVVLLYRGLVASIDEVAEARRGSR